MEKNNHFTGLLNTRNGFVFFDDLDKSKSLTLINEENSTRFADRISFGVYVNMGNKDSSLYDLPQIIPFDKFRDIPYNFLVISNIDEYNFLKYLTDFEKFMEGILKKELFSWRYRIFLSNVRKYLDNLNERAHIVALSNTQQLKASHFNDYLKKNKQTFEIYFTEHKKRKSEELITLVLMPDLLFFCRWTFLIQNSTISITNYVIFFFLKKKKILKILWIIT